MDFFSRQDQARRKTWLLILYFVFAILATVAVVNVVVNFALRFMFLYLEFSPAHATHGSGGWLVGDAWIYVSLITASVIISGSLYRLITLADGGVAVALMVGATPLLANSSKPADKTFTNVVEEMAIASGMPVPQLFVLENEASINAFVAGFRATESVMVVTRGALEQLDRDELQGVVGHEFSHILNGDMRINLRLLAILAGILLIGKIGGVMMRGAKEGDGRGALFILLFGVALYLVGYAGLFFGRVIKAAISRQREFLADAAAVQFTRHPRGLSGALFKIQESSISTLLHSAYAEDVNHMCIAEAMNMNSWLATHPPIEKRIQAIDPSYLGTQRAKKIIERKRTEAESGNAGSGHAMISSLADTVGNVSPQQLMMASEMHASMPSVLIQSLHAVDGAAYVIYALLGAQNLDADLQKQVHGLRAVTDKLDKRTRLPLIDMALPQLKQMDAARRDAFIQKLEAIVREDNRYTLNEFVILTIIKQHLSSAAGRADVVKYHSFKPLLAEVNVLLSMLARCSGQSVERRQRAWQQAMKVFSADAFSMYELAIQPAQVSATLEKIRQTPMLLKKSFINVCADLVMEDGIIMPAEEELLRAICESIDCPMPLLAAAK